MVYKVAIISSIKNPAKFVDILINSKIYSNSYLSIHNFSHSYNKKNIEIKLWNMSENISDTILLSICQEIDCLIICLNTNTPNYIKLQLYNNIISKTHIQQVYLLFLDISKFKLPPFISHYIQTSYSIDTNNKIQLLQLFNQLFNKLTNIIDDNNNNYNIDNTFIYSSSSKPIEIKKNCCQCFIC